MAQTLLPVDLLRREFVHQDVSPSGQRLTIIVLAPVALALFPQLNILHVPNLERLNASHIGLRFRLLDVRIG